MVDSFLLNFLTILENLITKKHVEIVVCILTEDHSVESSKQMESKITLYVMIGDKDILKDNGTYNLK